MKKKRDTTTKKTKRGFCVLDRGKALNSAVKAVGVFRELKTTKADAVRLGFGGALQILEDVLNGILRFSGGALPDDLFDRLVPEPLPEDVDETRRVAKGAVTILRKILKDARADLSVHVSECTQLDDAIDVIERALHELLPPPGAPGPPKLPFDDDIEQAI
jgi:hypothetical protein